MDEDIAIKVENLSKVFPLRQPQTDEDGNTIYQHWALKDVSFDIKKGESIGIIGPNGSGKSTLLKILAGVTKPTSGRVSIRGKVASILDIGAGFHPELSGRENVFLNGQIHGFSKKEIESRFNEIVGFSGIGKFIEEPVKNYSNGMYLRLAFSIMAHLDFDVYILDEVLGVGDVEFMTKSQSKLTELININNKTVVLISHNIYEISMICNSAINLFNGNLLAYGSSEDIIKTYSLKQHSETKNIFPDFIEEVKILLSDENDKEKSHYINDESILLHIHHSINDEKNENIKFALRVRDMYNQTLFSISPSLTKEGFKDLPLENSYSVSIPPFTFNEGEYFIDLVYFKQEGIINEIQNISCFSIKLSEKYQLNALGKKGAFKPFYDWD